MYFILICFLRMGQNVCVPTNYCNHRKRNYQLKHDQEYENFETYNEAFA